MQPSDFERLLAACAEIAEGYPGGVVYVDGIAVFMHTMNSADVREYAEFTHDAAFYISIAHFGDLRDAEETVANARLSKHQFVKAGFEFDVYTERRATLRVPYEDVAVHAVREGPLPLACLEHLLVLKLIAYADRKDSSKGAKDAKDILRICAVAGQRGGLRSSLVLPYLDKAHLDLLKGIEKGPYALMMARGNATKASRLRQTVGSAIAGLEGSGGKKRGRGPAP